MSRVDRFPDLMRAFFYEWLVEQRNASIHTVRSYRDTWRLLLRFVGQRAGKKVAMITLTDLTASEVAAFLSHAEHERGGTIGTRNCRLAAIRSFFLSIGVQTGPTIGVQKGTTWRRCVGVDYGHGFCAGAGVGRA